MCSPQILKIACLNVRGCSTSEGKRSEIGRMFLRRKLDVCALSETKMSGRGERMFGEVVCRVSGVMGGRAREGVGIILSERMIECVVEWKEVNSRLMWVKVKLGKEKWVFVSAYGPGSEKSMQDREQFWRELNACIGGFGRNESVVLLGDLNARVGGNMIEGVVGRYGVPGRNESGDWLVDLCMIHDLMVGNSLFKKRDINKYTWVKVEGSRVVERALMDYVVISKGMVGRLVDVHVYRGESGGMSDHFLVEGRLKVAERWKNKVNATSGRSAIKVCKLNDRNMEREYQERLRVEYERVCEKAAESVEVEWEWFRDSVNRCASEVCGMRRVGGTMRKGSEWWNEETKVAVMEKRRAFEVWLQTRNEITYGRYKEKRNMLKRMVKRAKREADRRWGQRLGEKFEENKKMFWKEVKRVRKGEPDVVKGVKDRQGNLLSEDGAVRKRWAEYFEQLLNVEDERVARIVAVGNGWRMPRLNEQNEVDVTKEEVERALSEVKSGKAPGLDGCMVECLKKGGVVVVDWLVRLFNVCFDRGMVPLDWCSACVVPLYKGKGDRFECGNSRGISLLSVVGKVYGRIVIKRVRMGTDIAIGDEQCGFRQGRGCVDQVFAVKQICEKYLEKGKDVFFAFMDLEKAYDRIDRAALWEVLGLYGVGGKLLNAVKGFYVESRACVRIGNDVSDRFPVKVGLRQGCVMSPWLFNVYMDGVVREVNARVLGRGLELVGENGQVYEVNLMLFADDTVIVADSKEKLCRLIDEFGKVCDRRKLRVNVSKSKVMRCSREENVIGMNVRMNGEQMEEVKSFDYLGVCIAATGELNDEVRHRVEEGCKSWGALKSVMRCRGLGMDAKKRLYESVVVPTVLYGSETWGMKEAEKRRLDVLEMNCLRSMVGVTRMDRIRNEEVRRRTGVVRELSSRVDQRVLRWFGHMERMSEERLVKKVMNSEVIGRRARGRPKFRWMDGVKRVLNEKNITLEEAKERARDRSGWREIVNA